MSGGWLDMFCQCVPAVQPFFAFEGVTRDESFGEEPRYSDLDDMSDVTELRELGRPVKVDVGKAVEIGGVLLILETLKAEKAGCGGFLPKDRMLICLLDMLKVVYDRAEQAAAEAGASTIVARGRLSKWQLRALICSCILRKLLGEERRAVQGSASGGAAGLSKGKERRGGAGTSEPASFGQALVQALPVKQRASLRSILADMPPSVLGDEVAREATRVFVNLNSDIYKAQDSELRTITPHRETVDIIAAVVKQCLDGEEKDAKRLSPVDRFFVLSGLLSVLNPPHQLKLVLEQMLLGRESLLSPDSLERADQLDDMFGAEQDSRE